MLSFNWLNVYIFLKLVIHVCTPSTPFLLLGTDMKQRSLLSLLLIVVLFLSFLFFNQPQHFHYQHQDNVSSSDSPPQNDNFTFSKYLPDNPRGITLKKKNNYTLPIPLLESKKKQWSLLPSLLDHFNLRDYHYNNGKKPSIGCTSKYLSSWYNNVPRNFCPLSTLFVYSEQHSGTILLSSHLHKAPGMVGIHELFCCENCTDRTLGLSTFLNLACSLRVHEVGAKKVIVGLQYNHFWHQTEEAIRFPQEQHDSSVLLLKRDNYLSFFFAGAGTKSPKRSHVVIPMDLLQSLPDRIREYQQKYHKVYCSLKKAGVPVILLTYENLIKNFTFVMEDVGEFVGIRRGKWSPRLVLHHHSLSDRVENFGEVKEYLEKNWPEYVCMLFENCEYPSEFVCDDGVDFSFTPLSKEKEKKRKKKKKKKEKKIKIKN